MDFDKARAKANQRLGGCLQQVRAGRRPEALDGFARAYLGLLLDVDDDLPPAERVRLLAEEPLASAVLEGFVAVLRGSEAPSPRSIGAALGRGERFPLGYTLIAGMERLYRTEPTAIQALAPQTLASVLCLHYANTANHAHPWAEALLVDRPDVAAAALHDFWWPLIEAGADHLPGYREVFGGRQTTGLRGRLILPLLRTWRHCKLERQKDLLYAALDEVAPADLLALAAGRCEEGSEMDVSRRVYWLATAYLLDPDAYSQALFDYCNRWREKTLPLLDFAVGALERGSPPARDLAPGSLAHLIRLIAPTFRRNEPLTGGLDAVSSKVLMLFDRLAADTSPEAGEAVQELRRVRVMRMYADVLDQVEARQGR